MRQSNWAFLLCCWCKTKNRLEVALGVLIPVELLLEMELRWKLGWYECSVGWLVYEMWSLSEITRWTVGWLVRGIYPDFKRKSCCCYKFYTAFKLSSQCSPAASNIPPLPYACHSTIALESSTDHKTITIYIYLVVSFRCFPLQTPLWCPFAVSHFKTT